MVTTRRRPGPIESSSGNPPLSSAILYAAQNGLQRFANRGPKPSRNPRRAWLTSRHSITRSGRTGLGIRIFHPQLVTWRAKRDRSSQQLGSSVFNGSQSPMQKRPMTNAKYPGETSATASVHSPKNLRLPPISRLNLGVVPKSRLSTVKDALERHFSNAGQRDCSPENRSRHRARPTYFKCVADPAARCSSARAPARTPARP